MATNIEIDLVLKKAIRLLHSTSSNSATELRQMLDDAIKQRYGSEKMLCKTLSKTHLEEERHFPGRVTTPPPQQIVQDDEIINLTASPEKPLSNSPDTIMDSDDGASSSAPAAPHLLTAADEDVNLKEFGDLNCCVCGEMMFTATNRLIECSQCGALYHQECHKPAISNEDASDDREHQWQCNSCHCVSPPADVVIINDDNSPIMPPTNKVPKTSSSFNRQEQQSSNKHRRSSKSNSGASSSSSSNVVMPTINVLSAADRGSKRSHAHSSSSKSSSRSRHAETSGTSSRRKSTK